jgi:hypothetical protein
MTSKRRQGFRDAIEQRLEDATADSAAAEKSAKTLQDKFRGHGAPTQQVAPTPQAAPTQQVGEPLPQVAATQQVAPTPQVGAPTAIDISGGYFKMPNAWADMLCATLDVYAQAVYTQLLRLSWGHRRETCTIGYPRLAERAGISVNGARKGIRELVARGLVEQIAVDLAASRQLDRGILWRVALPEATPTQWVAPTYQVGATRQVAATRDARMTEKKTNRKDMAPVAAAPAPRSIRSESEQEALAKAFVYERRREQPGISTAELRELAGPWCEEQGVDARFIADATRT